MSEGGIRRAAVVGAGTMGSGIAAHIAFNAIRTRTRERRVVDRGRDGDREAKVRDLEAKLEMAEANLRTILDAARGTSGRTDTVGDAEMDAILAVLRGDGEAEGEAERSPE